jgi:hypothetical protein
MRDGGKERSSVRDRGGGKLHEGRGEGEKLHQGQGKEGSSTRDGRRREAPSGTREGGTP